MVAHARPVGPNRYRESHGRYFEEFAIGDVYDTKRRADIWSRTAAIDLLNRSLLSGFLPVQMARAAGLHMLSAIPPLRYLAMHEGVAPGRGFRSFPEFLRKEIRRKHA